MTAGFANRAAVAGKIEWEGGLLEALDYGLKATDMPLGDHDLIDAWTELDRAFEAIRQPMSAVERLLEDEL